jgi:hypothetical protein
MKRTYLYLLIGVVFCIYAMFFIRSYQLELDAQLTYPLFDDGMISMEYGKNFAYTGKFYSGNNAEPTIGFTSYLWVLSIAAISTLRFTAFKLPYMVVFLNIIVLIIALYITSRLIDEIDNKKRENWRLVFWSVSLSSPALLFWTLRGMEVPLAILMLSIFINLAVKIKEQEQSIRTLSLLALASLAVPFARPDQAPIVFAIAALLVAYRKYLPTLVIIVFLSIGQLSYSLINKILFGQPASNSYFLKVVGTTTNDRLERWFYGLEDQLQHHWVYLFIFLIMAFIIHYIQKGYAADPNNGTVGKKFVVSFRQQLMLLVTMVGAAIWMYIGGDAWENIPILNRFLTSLIPFLIIFLHIEFKRIKNKRIVDFGVALIIILNGYYAIKMIGFDSYNDKKFSFLGYSIGKEFGNTVTVLNYWYGQPTYYADIFGAKSIDGLGKIDPIVAKTIPKLKFWPGHDRWNHTHSIGNANPDLIIGLPCPKPHDRGFDCNQVWTEVVEHYRYKPYTTPEGYTIFVSPSSKVPDINLRIEKMNQRIAHHFIDFKK